MPRFLSLGQLTETMLMLRIEWAHWAEDNCALKTEVREKWLNQFYFYLREGLEDLKIQVSLGVPNDIKPEK